MTLNISPETKIGKINNWDKNDFLKGKVDSYTIGDDTITKENLKKYLEDSKFSVSSNGVLYRTDKVGCIPGILDLWFAQRVKYKNEMKKYGKSGNKEKYAFFHKRQLVQKILLNSLYGVLGFAALGFMILIMNQSRQRVRQLLNQLPIWPTSNTIKSWVTLSWILIFTLILIVYFFQLHRYLINIPSWRDNNQDTIAQYVNDIEEEMQDYLNDFYDILSEKIFNVDKDKHRLEIKKEYVAKAGLWIAKKRYAQWIISDNGVPVDKLDVKGLDVKRSSFPKAFQECMGTVLIDILKGKTEDEISDYVVDFKKDMVNKDTKDIAKNSAVKNLSKYLPKGKRQLFQLKKEHRSSC